MALIWNAQVAELAHGIGIERPREIDDPQRSTDYTKVMIAT